jgi:hypothetical protein
VVTGLVLARLQVRGDAFDHVWAEDGKVFLSDAERHGLASLSYVYAGSLLTVPRVLAIAGEALPIRDYATYTVLVSALVVGALAAFVYLTAAKVLGSAAWAAVPALGMALTPALAVESLGNLANLEWFLIFAAFWAMLVPPRGTRPYVATIVAGLAALASPVAVLVAPAAVVAHGRKDALRSWPLLALLAGEVIQVIGIGFGSRSASGPARRGVSLHTAKSLFGHLFRGVLGPAYGPSSVRFVAGAVIGALLVWAWWLARRRRRLASVSLMTGLLILCAISAITGQSNGRYSAIAAMFVIAGLACLGPRLDRRAAVGSLVLLFLLCLVSFPADGHRLSGPSWSAAIARHDTECRRLRLAATDLPLSPPGWTVRLACS